MADKEAFLHDLPDLEAETTRLILMDDSVPRRSKAQPSATPFPNVSREKHVIDPGHEGWHHINALHYDRPYNTSEQFSFKEAQTYLFDVWDLQNICKPSSTGCARPLFVQNNVQESLVEMPASLDGHKRAQRETLFFGRHAIGIWQSISSIKTTFLSESRLEVTCDFSALPLRFRSAKDSEEFNLNLHVVDGLYFSLLKHHFLRTLGSNSSATLVPQKNATFASQMITLDFLTALVDCWIGFLTAMMLKTSTYASNLDTRSQSYNAHVLQNMSRIARDMEHTLQYTLDSACADLGDRDIETRTRLQSIGTENFAKLRAIKNRVEDFQSNLRSISGMTRALTEEQQAQSIKRLTLLAAVFLPLSLASSLLSMSTRAKDLGLLWYDYIGICTLLVFLVFIVYQSMRIRDLFTAIRATETARILGHIKRKSDKRVWSLAADALEFLTTPRHGSLKWTVMRSILSYSFIAASVASFWVGMWKDVGLGLKIWGFSAAGWLGTTLVVYILQFWTMFRSKWW